MDNRLVAWARAVKRRRPKPPRDDRGRPLPVLWLFTDPSAQPDLLAAIARLPGAPGSPYLCGVIFRHDGVEGRAALAAAAARLCRDRAVGFVMAGDAALARRLGAPRHARGGRGATGSAPAAALTASAHGPADLVRCRRAGIRLAFLSPVFATASHPGSTPLGPLRWARLACVAGLPVAALGGVTGRTARRLPRSAAFAGAIGALS